MVLIRARISLMHDLYMAWVKGMKSLFLLVGGRDSEQSFLPKIPKFPGLSFVACKMGSFHHGDM